MTLAKKDSTLAQVDSKEINLNQSTSTNVSKQSEDDIVKEDQDEKALESLFTLRDKNIHLFIKSRIKNAILVENIGSEMTYSISNKEDYTKTYESFFQQIEQNKDNLGNLFF